MVTPISPAELLRGTGNQLISPRSREDEKIYAKWNTLHITEITVPLEEIRFLVTTRIASWLACFKNSTITGAVNHTPFLNRDGQAVIKVDGRWIPIREMMDRIEWDAKQQKIVSKGHPYEIWSYDGMRGLIPRDRFHYDTLQPVYSLSPHEFIPLLAHANTFWSNKDEKRTSVLQLITTNHTPVGSFFSNESAATTHFEHVTFRLIDRQGQVYSFGVELEEEELDQISGTFDFCKTATAYLSSPDYEEPRRFVKKRVTSLSLTDAQLSGIVQFVSALNQGGLSFNYLKQNCSTMAREVLHRAGVSEPHESSSLLDYLFRYIREIPSIGEPLAEVISKIAAIVSFLPDFVGWIARKITTCCLKTAFVICGALNTTHVKLPEECPHNTAHITPFSRLVSSVADLFDERIDTHFKLIEWQMSQPTTRTFQFQNAPRLCGLVH